MMTVADAPAPTGFEGGPHDQLAKAFARIAVAAGALVMQIYEAGPTARLKADASPVCEADEIAEAFILDGLRKILPDVPVLAEEAAARGDKPYLDGRFLLVDPVDGTKEFLGRNGEFTVNIALIEHGVPRAGAVYAPALGRLWFAGEHAMRCSVNPGDELDQARDWRRLQTRPAPEQGLTVMASRSHKDPQTEALLETLPVTERRSAGSSLKFCAIAEGNADLYPRFGTTMEWDTGAGHAVLQAAGGTVRSLDGAELIYGKRGDDFRNSGFMAWGRQADAERFADHVALTAKHSSS